MKSLPPILLLTILTLVYCGSNNSNSDSSASKKSNKLHNASFNIADSTKKLDGFAKLEKINTKQVEELNKAKSSFIIAAYDMLNDEVHEFSTHKQFYTFFSLLNKYGDFFDLNDALTLKYEMIYERFIFMAIRKSLNQIVDLTLASKDSSDYKNLISYLLGEIKDKNSELYNEVVHLVNRWNYNLLQNGDFEELVNVYKKELGKNPGQKVLAEKMFYEKEGYNLYRKLIGIQRVAKNQKKPKKTAIKSEGKYRKTLNLARYDYTKLPSDMPSQVAKLIRLLNDLGSEERISAAIRMAKDTNQKSRQTYFPYIVKRLTIEKEPPVISALAQTLGLFKDKRAIAYLLDYQFEPGCRAGIQDGLANLGYREEQMERVYREENELNREIAREKEKLGIK